MSRTIESEDIVRFTELSGDRNPVHYDAEAAARTAFGEIVVQGGVTSAILNALVAEKLPGPGTVFLETHWHFRAPTRPGDTITGEVEVTAVREDKPITTLNTRVVRGMAWWRSTGPRSVGRCTSGSDASTRGRVESAASERGRAARRLCVVRWRPAATVN